MKSKVFKSLLAIACLLSSTSVSAYDFEVDGIYYYVVSPTNLTCGVTFGNNKYQGEIVIPETVNYGNRTLTVVSIYPYAFKDCYALLEVTIPNSIKEICNDAFSGCSSLTEVTIVDGERTLSFIDDFSKPFNGCPLEKLYLGRNISYGKNSPFCSLPIKSLTIGNSVTTIGDSAFSGCSPLTELTIGNSVTTIGDLAFYGCSSLTSLTIGNSVTTIGSYAFQHCSSLTSLTIGNSVTTIGYNAFYGCSSLTSLTIGNSVMKIGRYAFSDCSSLTEVYSLNPTPPRVESSNFTNSHYLHTNVYVPQEALETYQNAEPWKNFWNLQGFDATGIENIKLGNKGSKEDAVYYDLSGRWLNTPRRGLNIVNGKKVINR